MKMGQKNAVPLTEILIKVLQAQKDKSSSDVFVFPKNSDANKHVDENSFLNHLKRAKGDKYTTNNGMCGVDRTWLEEKGKHKIKYLELALQHDPRSSHEKAYDLSEYFPQHKAILEDWNLFCWSKII